MNCVIIYILVSDRYVYKDIKLQPIYKINQIQSTQIKFNQPKINQNNLS